MQSTLITYSDLIPGSVSERNDFGWNKSGKFGIDSEIG